MPCFDEMEKKEDEESSEAFYARSASSCQPILKIRLEKLYLCFKQMEMPSLLHNLKSSYI